MDRKFITPEQAINLLNDSNEIHTFRNPNGILVGCDWKRENIIKHLTNNPDKIEIGGETCRLLKHGLIVEDNSGFLFIETNEEKLNAFDPLEQN